MIEIPLFWPVLVFICQAVIFSMTRKNPKHKVIKYLSLVGMLVVVEWVIRIYVFN